VSDTTEFLTSNAGQDIEINAQETDSEQSRPRRRGTGLSGMLLPELQSLASGLGITGTARMRKGDLVAAIEARQGGNGDAGETGTRTVTPAPAGPVPAESPQAVDQPPPRRGTPVERSAQSSEPVAGLDTAPAGLLPFEPDIPNSAPPASSVAVATPETAVRSESEPAEGPGTTAGELSGDSARGAGRDARGRRASSRPAGTCVLYTKPSPPDTPY
jgi:transcription termination factor Rho